MSARRPMFTPGMRSTGRCTWEPAWGIYSPAGSLQSPVGGLHIRIHMLLWKCSMESVFDSGRRGTDSLVCSRCKREDTLAGGDGDELLVVEHEGHGRSPLLLVGVKLPEGPAGGGVGRHKGAAVLAEEYQAARGREQTGRGGGGRGSLRKVPGDFAGLDVDRAHGFYERLSRGGAGGAAHIAFTGFPLDMALVKDVAALERLEVIKAGGGVERSGIPVGAALETRADVNAAAGLLGEIV